MGSACVDDNVGSSYNRMRGPGIGCWFSDCSNSSYWSLTLTLTCENLSLYTTLLLLLVLCSPRCWHPTTVVQGVNNHNWGLDCRRCYCIRVCWGRPRRIFHFSCWLGQLSTVLTKDESPHTGYTFTPGGSKRRSLTWQGNIFKICIEITVNKLGMLTSIKVIVYATKLSYFPLFIGDASWTMGKRWRFGGIIKDSGIYLRPLHEFYMGSLRFVA